MGNKRDRLPARRLEIARSIIGSMNRGIGDPAWFGPDKRDTHAAIIAAWSMNLVILDAHFGTFIIGERDVTSDLEELTGWDTRS